MKRARKIQFLKRIQLEKGIEKEYKDHCGHLLGTLKKLQIVFKVPKQERPNCTAVKNDVRRMMDSQQVTNPKDWVLPDRLCCPISGDIMEDPVILSSGQSYERESIERYLKLKR